MRNKAPREAFTPDEEAWRWQVAESRLREVATHYRHGRYVRKVLVLHAVVLFLCVSGASLFTEGLSRWASAGGTAAASLVLMAAGSLVVSVLEHSWDFPVIRGGLVAGGLFLLIRWLRTHLGWAPALAPTWGLLALVAAGVCVVLSGAVLAVTTAGVLQDRSPMSA